MAAAPTLLLRPLRGEEEATRARKTEDEEAIAPDMGIRGEKRAGERQ
jgi:hypothetical protein